MACSETLAARIRQRLARRQNAEEKKMFGGIGFMLNSNMCGASTAILRKLDFVLTRTVHHPEDGDVWEWCLPNARTMEPKEK